MKHIVLTIILFLIFFKTFALKSSVNCDDIYFDSAEGIKFLANHQVELTISGPHKVESPGNFTCCLQQGPMMVGNYKFSKGGTTIYTVLSDVTWENGYNMGNILDANNCLSKIWGKYFDCNTIYEGQYEYTRVDNYDPTKFPSPGEAIGLEFTVYAHCFNQCETICLKSCDFVTGISYDPPPPPK
ncbi:hypothetical protein RhiirA4_475268 [Rhizophagus irregularis]|uniref:Uncharacterized protein n=1 Tax=Rhizophagus irregularis TaxID=588596 RepID=A0A2I1H9X4_9GLOM|nr:hypothetical protein RhiirA4_475268 [Rhizophagus irregularis]